MFSFSLKFWSNALEKSPYFFFILILSSLEQKIDLFPKALQLTLRTPDRHDLFMVSGHNVFSRGNQLLKELFPWPEPGILDSDVLFRL